MASWMWSEISVARVNTVLDSAEACNGIVEKTWKEVPSQGITHTSDICGLASARTIWLYIIRVRAPLGSYPADSPNRSYYIMSKRVTYGLLQAGSKNRLGGLVAILAGQKIPPCSEVLTSTKKGLPARKKHLKVSIHFLLGFSRRPQNYIWCKYENFHIVCVVVVQSGPCPA